MLQAKLGNTVKVHYTGKLDDGTVVATSINAEPLRFVIGGERIIGGLEEAVVGMRPGESKTTKVQADKAFGPHDEDLVRVVKRGVFPTDLDPKVGQKLNMTERGGRTTVVTVIEISGSKVTLDTNHPLAGKDVTFDIELVEIL
ncbi:MAG: FKBP-type peptidyl-prolyl cis-trans isomerase [Planctomycetota bacterium]|jgi:peptidylprolyl isomerase